jgi:hypothetical protein
VLIGISFYWPISGLLTSNNRQVLAERKHVEDSLARIKALTAPKADPQTAALDSMRRDSLNLATAAGKFSN